MQQELAETHPDLPIQILGVNEAGQEWGNSGIVEGRDIPWLQDVDADEDGQSDVWHDKWDVTFRDVVILDRGNHQVGTYNVTTHDLGNPLNYETLLQMLIDAAAAKSAWYNETNPFDVDKDGDVTPVEDVLPLINELNQLEVIDASGWLPEQWDPGVGFYYDVDGDGYLTAAGDVLLVINHLNADAGLTGEGEADLAGFAEQSSPVSARIADSPGTGVAEQDVPDPVVKTPTESVPLRSGNEPPVAFPRIAEDVETSLWHAPTPESTPLEFNALLDQLAVDVAFASASRS
jgi:hypothetical protein